MIYRDRIHGGQVLAELLDEYKEQDACILGLPRGGVVVAAQIADRLALPLDALVARKLGVPGSEEVAFGAIGPGEVIYIDEKMIQQMDLSQEQVDRVVELERRELERRLRRYRDGEQALDISGRPVVLVDDGVATGSTMRAALYTVQAREPSEVIVAAPVGSPEVIQELERGADRVVCPTQPDALNAVSQWYREFDPVEDEEVVRLMREYGPQHAAKRS